MTPITILKYEFKPTKYDNHYTVKIHYEDGNFDKVLSVGMKRTNDDLLVFKQPQDTNGAIWCDESIDFILAKYTGPALVEFGMGMYNGRPCRRCFTQILPGHTLVGIEEAERPLPF